MQQFVPFSFSPFPIPLFDHNPIEGGLNLLDVIFQLVDSNLGMVTFGGRFFVHQNIQSFAVTEMKKLLLTEAVRELRNTIVGVFRPNPAPLSCGVWACVRVCLVRCAIHLIGGRDPATFK